EKVSITAATVVGFLIAGTIALGAEKAVEFTTADNKGVPKVTVQVVGVDPADVDGATNSISVEQYEALTDTVEATKGALAGLLTVTTDSEGVTTFALGEGDTENNTLGTVSAKATENGELTLIKTDGAHTSITSELTIEAAGVTEDTDIYTSTAMEADGDGHTVTNGKNGKITVGDYAVGMSAKNGATAENAADATIIVNGTDAVGMVASGKGETEKSTATNAGTITVTKGTGMLAKDGGAIKNAEEATITAGADSTAGTGMSVTGNGTATNAGAINVGIAGSVGMSATTAATETAILTNDGKIDVTLGTGISVAGTGTANVTFGEKGTIDVKADQTGISVAGTGTTTITGGKITGTGTAVGIDVASGTLTMEGTEISVGEGGTGIKATGNANITLKDGVILDLTNANTGTGIAYTGKENTTVTTANISTKGITVGEGAAGITATMSKAAGSILDITTGSIETTNANVVGIAITGTELTALNAGETPSTATVTTTLGNTLGTGVKVTGAANNNITVTLQDIPKETTPVEKATVDNSDSLISIAKGIDVTDNSDGIININVNQKNLQVTETGNLVNVGAIKGTTTVNINQDVVLGAGGNIVKVAKDLGSGGVLNINLNVKDENDSAKALTVKENTTALDLESIGSNGVTSVKNTGSVTIEGKGTLIKGHNTNTISLTNQGFITLSTVSGNGESKTDNSVISTGKAVKVANYGTITLSINSADFIAASKAKVTTLDQLTTDQVQTALENLGVITDESTEGSFSSVGFIKLTDGLFTTAQKLEGEQTVENLAATLNHQSEDKRAFSVAKGGNATIKATAEGNKLENVHFSLNGTMTIDGAAGEGGTIIPVIIDNAGHSNQILIEEEGQLAIAAGKKLIYSGNIEVTNTGDAAITVADGGTFTLSNGTLTMEALNKRTTENRVGLSLGNSNFELDNSTADADIEGILSGGNLQGTITSTGNSTINNKVTDIKTIAVENGMLTFGANSKIALSNDVTSREKTTIKLTDGKMKVELGENGVNVLQSSEGSIKFEGTYGNKDTHNTANKGKVVLATSNLTEDTTFTLGNHEGLDTGDITANGDMYYTIVQDLNENKKWTAKFNNDLLLNVNNGQYAELNNIYAATQSIHDLLSDNLDVRATELDNIYSNNIYSETVKMSLDTLKMNEDAVLSLNVRPKQGEFTAQGKFLFNNTDYDREGVTRDYKVETKNTGLLGAMEYGLTDTSSVGFAFSGTKQDLDMKNGASADGDAFYFGLYRNDTFNNIDLTTGLGYMTDRVDAKSFVGKDKFDSTAFSGYIQGKYNYAIAENLTLSPKAKLTVTRFQQDSINTGRMKQEEIKDTMADVELGVELKKGIALETGKMNLLAGA
ncbi:autotransporter domain-containing protein, partial [Fusobacterium ulcerans]|uniref:autotransporter domain-containing protein n=1 Tax=Fusobacterium ulcerans TaxID=861 RepID=UPI001D0B2DF1